MHRARAQAECTAMTAPSTAIIPAPSAPRSPTFLIGPDYRSANARHVPGARQASTSGLGEVIGGPHRPMTSSIGSAEPRAQRDLTLPIWYSPAGRTPRALPTGRAAMAENSVKKAESAVSYKMADGQLARAKPGHHRTSPGDPPRPRHALRTVPTR